MCTQLTFKHISILRVISTNIDRQNHLSLLRRLYGGIFFGGGQRSAHPIVLGAGPMTLRGFLQICAANPSVPIHLY